MRRYITILISVLLAPQIYAANFSCPAADSVRTDIMQFAAKHTVSNHHVQNPNGWFLYQAPADFVSTPLPAKILYFNQQAVSDKDATAELNRLASLFIRVPGAPVSLDKPDADGNTVVDCVYYGRVNYNNGVPSAPYKQAFALRFLLPPTPALVDVKTNVTVPTTLKVGTIGDVTLNAQKSGAQTVLKEVPVGENTSDVSVAAGDYIINAPQLNDADTQVDYCATENGQTVSLSTDKPTVTLNYTTCSTPPAQVTINSNVNVSYASVAAIDALKINFKNAAGEQAYSLDSKFGTQENIGDITNGSYQVSFEPESYVNPDNHLTYQAWDFPRDINFDHSPMTINAVYHPVKTVFATIKLEDGTPWPETAPQSFKVNIVGDDPEVAGINIEKDGVKPMQDKSSYSLGKIPFGDYKVSVTPDTFTVNGVQYKVEYQSEYTIDKLKSVFPLTFKAQQVQTYKVTANINGLPQESSSADSKITLTSAAGNFSTQNPLANGDNVINDVTANNYTVQCGAVSVGSDTYTAADCPASIDVPAQQSFNITYEKKGPAPKLGTKFVGYWEAWGGPNQETGKYLYYPITDVNNTYNVINVAFAAVPQDNGVVVFDPGMTSKDNPTAAYQNIPVLTPEQVLAAKENGQRKIVLSVGGALNNFFITSDEQRQNFISSLTAIVDKYHFDGVDFDVEHGFTVDNAHYMVDVIKFLRDKYGPDFLITMAPETNNFSPFWGYGGANNSYSEVINQLRALPDAQKYRINWVQIQLYNSGTPDGTPVNTAAFAELFANAMLNGWEVVGQAQKFTGLSPDQIVLGFPATSASAGSGLFPYNEIKSAYKNLNADAEHHKVGGIMTWDANWDNSGYGQNPNDFVNKLSPCVLNNQCD